MEQLQHYTLFNTNQKETWDLFLKYIGLLGVPLAGTFALGIFTKRANGAGALLGLVVAGLVCWYIQDFTTYAKQSPFIFSGFSFLSALVFGYICSFFFKSTKNITGLTIYTKDQEYVKEAK